MHENTHIFPVFFCLMFDVGRLPTFLRVYIIFSHNGLTFLIVKYIINTKNKSKDKDVLGMNIMPLLFFYFFVKFK